VPARGRDEQRPAVLAAKHAGEAPPIGGDCSEHLTTLPHTLAALARNTRDPYGAVRVGADAVGRVREVSPDTAAGEGPVGCHVERDELLGVRISDDQRAAVAGQRHAVGPLQAVRDLARAAIWLNAHDYALAPVHVRITGRIDHELIERRPAECGQVRQGVKFSVRLLAQECALRPVDDEHPPVRKPVNAERDGPLS
jgi:hypothetical protein